MQTETRRVLLEALIILILGCLVGISVNYRLVLDVLSGGEPNPVSAAEPASGYPVPVGLDEARALWEGGALPVDARAAEMYEEGHLPDAFSLPLARWEEEIAGFRRKAPFDRTMLVYCSGFGCSDSFDLGLALIKEGYRDVRVFEGGFPAWSDAGFPVEEGGR